MLQYVPSYDGCSVYMSVAMLFTYAGSVQELKRLQTAPRAG